MRSRVSADYMVEKDETKNLNKNVDLVYFIFCFMTESAEPSTLLNR